MKALAKTGCHISAGLGGNDWAVGSPGLRVALVEESFAALISADAKELGMEAAKGEERNVLTVDMGHTTLGICSCVVIIDSVDDDGNVTFEYTQKSFDCADVGLGGIDATDIVSKYMCVATLVKLPSWRHALQC